MPKYCELIVYKLGLSLGIFSSSIHSLFNDSFSCVQNTELYRFVSILKACLIHRKMSGFSSIKLNFYTLSTPLTTITTINI